MVNRWARSSLTSKRRPGLVTWFSLGVLILSAIFLIRFTAALQLPDLPLTVPAGYLALTGAIWGVAGTLLSYGLFTGKGWGRAALPWGVSAFLVWYWIDRILFTRSEYAARSWPFALLLTALGLVWMLWMMRRKGFREYFEENAK